MSGSARTSGLRQCTFVVCTLLLWAIAIPRSWAVELFRYQNDQGVTVISYSIPPDLVHKGYTVLSEDGRVIRVVERELSPAEQVERNKHNDAEQYDADLQRRYASPHDVELDRDRRLAELDQSITRAKQELERSQVRLVRYQREAAETERGGQAPTKATLDNIERTQQQINTYTREVDGRQVEKEQVIKQFQRDEKRVRELYNFPLEEPPETPAVEEPGAAHAEKPAG